MTDLRVPGASYDLAAGQEWWIRATVRNDQGQPIDLTDHDLTSDVTAVLWHSWTDRTVVPDTTITIRSTPDARADGVLWFGQASAAASGVFYVAVADRPGEPRTALAGVAIAIKASGVRS